MILDLDELADGSVLDADVCIVGAGAAGICLATELAGRGRGVLLLESGGRTADDATRELSRAVIEGRAYAGAWHGRARVLGGATTLWGGQALPLTPIDFEARDWVPHSGWPFGIEELRQYYARASAFLGVGELPWDADLGVLLGTGGAGLDPDVAVHHLSKWSPEPDLARRHRATLERADGARVLLHANATELVLADDHRTVRELRIRSLGGRAGVVRSREVVLCAGGIENARLLLASTAQQPAGIGNGHDLVGRFLQDHPGARIARLSGHDDARLQALFNVFRRDRRKYSIRLSASETFQRRHRTLNVSTALMFRVGDDAPYAALRRLLAAVGSRRVSRAAARDAIASLAGARGLARTAFAYLARGRTWTPDASAELFVSAEQEPDPESRVTLAAERDALGMPRARIDWRIGEGTRRSVALFAAALREQFRRAGLGELTLEPWVEADGGEWRERLVDHYHHIGTTRMSDSPASGVVDAELRVHGIENLRVASSSVFPTGGHSNPTLTMLALCIRLADRLRSA